MEKELIALEYDKVLHALSEHAVSECGRQFCLQLRPLSTAEQAREALAQTDCADRLLLRFGVPSLSAVSDVTGACRRASNGAVLSIKELLQAAEVLKAAERLITFLEEHLQPEDTCFESARTSLTANRFLADKLSSSFLSEEEVADAASTELAQIRRKQQAAKARIKSTLDGILRTHQKSLQESIVTIRNGRYVIPVKAEHRADINGLVHDTSSSGATLFIEPMQVVNANNDLNVLQSQEHAEIERILAQLSALVGEYGDAIAADFETERFFDFCFAKARYAQHLRAVCPALREDGVIRVKGARHPLIGREVCVPIDLELGDTYSALIVTGPNTGGKTVSLKTTGLLCLMAASGLFVPTQPQPQVAYFDHVFADIGDEQSIEQSLSTFSAHMSNIVDILSKTDENSLVLLDELGSGTDPTEGAALAVAIIESLLSRGAKVMCTTHYAELKLYAVQTPYVENASCEFDVATLKPTYKLMIGIPGKSNAFAIARRLGLDEVIIDNARKRLDSESVKVEHVLADLEINRKTVQHQTEMAEQLRLQAQQELRRAQEALERNTQQAEQQLNQAKQKALEIVERARREAKAVTKQLDDLRRERERADFKARIDASRAVIEKKLDRLEEENTVVPKRTKEAITQPLKEGDPVRIFSLGGKQATVLAPADKNGKVSVAVGSAKLKVSIEDLEPDRKPRKPVQSTTTLQMQRASERQVQTELDLRGMTVMDAELAVDEFLNNCALSGLHTVSIIHGKGTGALRAAVRQKLKRCKMVDSFRLGVFGEGEDGVTIVTLK